jgi:hypothetical protein
MSFIPPGEPLGVKCGLWKPNRELTGLALRRCDWVNCDEINALEGDEWLRAIVVSCYYQGLADGVKHMARKYPKAWQKE